MRRVSVALALFLLALPAVANTRRATFGNGLVAALVDNQRIYLEAVPQRGEGFYSFTTRFTGSDEAWRQIRRLNGNHRRLYAGRRYRVPFSLLTGAYKSQVLKALFPNSEPRAEGWYHQVPQDSPGQTLWRLAEWYSGNGRNFPQIHELNNLPENTLLPGQSLIVPRGILLPELLALLPEAPPIPPPPVVAIAEQDLAPPVGSDYTYERRETGDYLVYRLKRGEALYTAVAMRFSGAVVASAVNQLAAEIAELNGFRDVTDLEIGTPVRVPFDTLLPEYLPAKDPRRQEYETARAESDKYSNTVRTSTLEGITVILDAGHGGDDPGSKPKDVWESTTVYDIMLRTRKILTERTAARVEATTRDGSSYRIVDSDKLPQSRGHQILTNPPYRIGDTTVGTHFRWYLANSIHRSAVKKSGDAQKTVFISIHADYLHSSVRGAMVYIPAASLTKGPYAKHGSVYTRRAEVKEKQTVDFSWKERTKSEGLSRQFAETMLASFRRQGLAIHRDKPIRDRVIRCRGCRAWVPAVIRRNAVPAKMLLEVGNLNNSQDRRLLQTRAHRQQLAEAIVDGILAYYGQSMETTAGP